MSAFKRITFGVAIAWISRLVTAFSGLLLMPFLFRLINKEELGIWFLLGNSQQFISLLGFGIAPTLTRYIAFAKGKSGSDVNVDINEESKKEIADLVFTGQVVLRTLAVFVFFVACISGYLLIRQLTLKEAKLTTVIIAWVLLCAGNAIGVWVSYLNCWLTGIGYVGWEGVINTSIYLISIVSNIVIAFAGFGLLGLSTVTFVSGLVQRFATIAFLRSVKPELFKDKGTWDKSLAVKLFKPSLLAWLTGLGGLLIHRTDAYFIAFFQGAQSLPNYQVAYVITSTVYSFSISLADASPTFISQAWQAGDIATVHLLTIRNAQIGMSFMAAGSAFLLTVGKELFSLWLGNNSFVGYGVLIVFCIMFTLEAQQMNLVTSARATEDEKYVPAALTAGVLNIFFTWLLIKPFGLLGVALGTMIAQMLTNNWYAVYRPIIRLKLDFKVYLKKVVLLWVQLFLVSLSISFTVKYFLHILEMPNWCLILAVLCVCGFTFCAFMWNKVIDNNQRDIISSKLRHLINQN